MIALGLLLSLSILITGTDLIAVQVIQARPLDLPGSAAIGWIPAITTLAYFLAVLAIRRLKKPLPRWTGFILASFLAYGVIGLASGIYLRPVVAIPLPAAPSKETLAAFDAAYPVKRGVGSSSLEGHRMWVRRSDYSEAMADFARDLVARQDDPPAK